MIWIFLSLSTIYVALAICRGIFAYAELRRQLNLQSNQKNINEEDITVLQPILGGDPALEYCLEQNLKNAPLANFIWLLDKDDHEGQLAAKNAIVNSKHNNVICSINPCPPNGVNPKMWKLSLGLENTTTKFVAILDDDTILPSYTLSKAASIAASGNLVTGLPVYDSRMNFLSRLVTGFVNANSILTYLPTSYLKISNTINGMFTVMRRMDIDRSDLDSINHKVTDDYALARLFKDKGLGIKQTVLIHPIITTVTSFSHYNNLMKRWLVFARIYLRENLAISLLFLIVLPAILPLSLLLLAMCINEYAAFIVFILLLMKAIMVHKIYSALGYKKLPISDMLFEIIAELLTPLHSLWALINPGNIKWRKRKFILNDAGIINGESL